MQAVGHGSDQDAAHIALLVEKKLDARADQESDFVRSVEEIQDIVEDQLMDSDFHDVAKSYILYRAKRAEERNRNIFKRRLNLKPYEYPELLQYVDAVRHSYWIHTEFNFTSDVQDFNVNVSPIEKNAIKNTMLAIAQIEVAVKTFRGDVYKKMPKPEI
jgi:ribonucleoside-diphosphate reductase beta chain